MNFFKALRALRGQRALLRSLNSNKNPFGIFEIYFIRAFLYLKEKRGKRSKKTFRFTVSAAGNCRCDRSRQRFHCAKALPNPAVGFKAKTFRSLQREAIKPNFCAYLLQKINGLYWEIKRVVPSNFCMAKIRSGSASRRDFGLHKAINLQGFCFFFVTFFFQKEKS